MPSIEREMPTFKNSYLCVLAILICGNVAASEKKFRTGFVQEISEDRIYLDMQHTGIYSQIGFVCAPEICKTTNNFKIGDEVLVTLGAVDGKNKLLSIRKCVPNDVQCREVKKSDIAEEAERKRESEAFFENHRQCREKMNADLARNNSFFPENDSENSDKTLKQYNIMNKHPKYKQCLSKFVESYQDSVLGTCLKHGCGNNIGGGCYHIVGYSITTSVLEAAVEKCGD